MPTEYNTTTTSSPLGTPQTEPAVSHAAARPGLSRGVWIAIALISIALLAVIVIGILSRAAAERRLEQHTEESSVLTVAVTHPIAARLTPEIALPGNTQAFTDTPIYSRTNGYLKRWYFDIGARVKKGQLMATIETPEVDQQLQVAQANLKSAQANLGLANTTATRYQDLLKSNSVSKQETDQATSGALAQTAAVDAAMAGVRRLEQLQSFENVYAPFDGIVTARNTDVGALIDAGSAGATPKELFHMAAIGQIRVYVPVPEIYAADIRNGATAYLTLDEFPGERFDGVIARNSSAIDPASRTLNVEVDVPNAGGKLLPGSYVFAHFKTSMHPDSFTIPANTLLFRSEGLRVGVVRNGTRTARSHHHHARWRSPRRDPLRPPGQRPGHPRPLRLPRRRPGGSRRSFKDDDATGRDPADRSPAVTRLRAVLSAALTSTLLSGCMVGPKYVKPNVPTAPTFKEAPTTTAYKEDGAWHTAQPADQLPKGEWWTVFADPGLNDLEPRIITGNQTVRIADANLQRARAQIRVNRADLYPTVGAAPFAGATRYSANRPYFNASSANNGVGDLQLPIDVSWEIDLFGRIRRTVNIAREEAQASAADYQNVILSLQAELAIDYFELRAADAEKKLLNDTVAQYQEALRVTNNRFLGGVSAKSDVSQAETQLEAARVQASDVDVRRAQYEHAIALLIGQPPALLTLASAPLQAQPPAIPAGLPSELLERRPDIAAAERRTAEANQQIGIARAAFFPSLGLSGLVGFEGTSAANLLDKSSFIYALGPTLGQTFFDSGRRRAISEQAFASYNSETASYRQTTLTAYQQVEDNLSALRILAEEAEQQRRATAAAQEAQQIFNNRYVGGVDTYLQVITAQTAALNNERNDIDIMRRRMDASVLLVKALGGGWNASQLPKF